MKRKNIGEKHSKQMQGRDRAVCIVTNMNLEYEDNEMDFMTEVYMWMDDVWLKRMSWVIGCYRIERAYK